MLKLHEEKHYSQDKPIEILPAPKKVYLPISQHTGSPCNQLKIKKDEYVNFGQCLAESDGKLFSPIHASISGKVTAIQEWPHPVLERCTAIAIENDNQDKNTLNSPKDQKIIETLSGEQIREMIFKAGIVGLGGAAFPTQIKLNPPKAIDTLIINCAECEPYLTCDYRLMLEKTNEIILGIKLSQKCLPNLKRIIIAIEDNKPKAIRQFEILAKNEPLIKIHSLKSSYPQGGEKQLIKNVLKREVPSGKLPFDTGVIVQNVATIYAIYQAIYQNRPLVERVVTVTGSCLTNPKNLLARLGTPIQELIDYCGPIKTPYVKIIAGGPMMGIAQYDSQTPVIKATSGILLLTAREAKNLAETECIRCGACIRHCPTKLMPCLLNLASNKELWQQTKEYGALDCIECGSCSYVCPANRALVQTIKRAKLALRNS